MVVLCCYAVAGAPEVPLGTVSVRKRFERRAGGVPLLPHIHVLIIGVGPSLVQGALADLPTGSNHLYRLRQQATLPTAAW